jgi:hypothetical protein
MNKDELISFGLGVWVGTILLSLYLSNATSVQVVTILVGTLTIALTVWMIKTTRRHNKLSSTPIITLHTHQNNELFLFSIKNSGVGVAKIIKFNILLEGDSLKLSEFYEHFLSITGGTDRNGIVCMLSSGDCLVVGEEQKIINIEDEILTEEIISLIKNSYVLELEYESIYGDNYQILMPLSQLKC